MNQSDTMLTAHCEDEAPDAITDEPSHWQRWRPTQAQPGSNRKLSILEERAQLRLPLFHPEDAIRERCRRARKPRMAAAS